MDLLIAVAAILGSVLIGAISPGPSFVVVARTAIAASRIDGLAVALGMGLGGAVFAGAALLGLHVVLTSVPWVYLGLKVVGAAYLIYLAVRLWRGAGKPLDIPAAPRARRISRSKSLFLGLTTQLSNPKTALVYASLFTALLPADAPLWLGVIIVPMVFGIETGWYALVALILSSERPRRRYLQSKRWIDRLAGGAMGLLGLKLMSETR